MGNKKYYLVNYTYQPVKGSPIFPLNAIVVEFDESKNVKECYDEVHDTLNKGGDSDNVWEAFRCVITDMKRLD